MLKNECIQNITKGNYNMKETIKTPQKETICVRLKPKTVAKIDKLRENKEEKRSEFLRNLIEKTLEIL